MKKRAVLTAGKTSSDIASAKELVHEGTRILELQEQVRAGSVFFFFDVLDSHFQQVRSLQAALKQSRQQLQVACFSACYFPIHVEHGELESVNSILKFISKYYPEQLQAAAGLNSPFTAKKCRRTSP